MILGTVRDVSDDVGGCRVGSGECERFGQDDPAGSVALSGAGRDGGLLVEPQASQTNIAEGFDHEECHVRVLIELGAAALEGDVVPFALDWVADTITSSLVPDEVVDERLPSVLPVDEARVDGCCKLEGSLLRVRSWLGLTWITTGGGRLTCGSGREDGGGRGQLRGRRSGSRVEHIIRARRRLVVVVANKGCVANCVLVDSGVDGSTGGTAMVGPTVESLTAVLGGNGDTGVESIRGRVLDADSPNIAVAQSSSDALGSPGIDAVVVRNLNDLIRSIRVLGGSVRPFDVLVPVDLTRSRPLRLLLVVSNAAVTEDEVLIGVLRSGSRDQTCGEADGELDAGHRRGSDGCGVFLI